jgi:hypothetical protein
MQQKQSAYRVLLLQLEWSVMANGEVTAVGMAVATNGDLLTTRILVVMMLMSMCDHLKMPCMHEEDFRYCVTKGKTDHVTEAIFGFRCRLVL